MFLGCVSHTSSWNPVILVDLNLSWGTVGLTIWVDHHWISTVVGVRFWLTPLGGGAPGAPGAPPQTTRLKLKVWNWLPRQDRRLLVSFKPLLQQDVGQGHGLCAVYGF